MRIKTFPATKHGYDILTLDEAHAQGVKKGVVFKALFCEATEERIAAQDCYDCGLFNGGLSSYDCVICGYKPEDEV